MKKWWFEEGIDEAWMTQDEPRLKFGEEGPYYLASDVDARIAELEKALSQIALGADSSDQCGDNLTYSEIESIALGALRRPAISLRSPL